VMAAVMHSASSTIAGSYSVHALPTPTARLAVCAHARTQDCSQRAPMPLSVPSALQASWHALGSRIDGHVVGTALHGLLEETRGGGKPCAPRAPG
jgi:hypothetical protein